jgi:hypothetical protein
VSTLGATCDVRNRSIKLLQVSLNDGQQLPTMRRQLYVAGRAVEPKFLNYVLCSEFRVLLP